MLISLIKIVSKPSSFASALIYRRSDVFPIPSAPVIRVIFPVVIVAVLRISIAFLSASSLPNGFLTLKFFYLR